MSELRIAALKDQNEIMRAYNNELRAENERLAKRIEQVCAANERLKAALKEIAEADWEARSEYQCELARAALADQGKR